MLNVVFTGPDTDFFGTAFFDFSSLPFFDVTVTSSDSSQVVLQQTANGAITTFTGTGFAVDGDGLIAAGTISGIEFSQDGSVNGTFDGMTWDAATFYNGLVQIGSSGKTNIFDSLVKQQDIYVDARDAIVSLDDGGVVKGFSRKYKFDGSAFNDTSSGGLGRDTFKGFNGKDTFSGKAGNDRLIGGQGKDDLRGGKGQDKIDGGKGADLLNGGKGADMFLFKGNRAEGRDHISDFEGGVDLIRIKGLSFDDLTIRKANGGTDTKITLSGGTEIFLDDVQKSTIDADDFLFI